MATPKNIQGFILRALLPALALLCACDGQHNTSGMNWQAPEEKSMPYGFTNDSKVPYFARLWRMPRGFRGFTERWNERVRNHLTDNATRQVQECLQTYQTAISACPGSDARKAAAIRKRAEWQKFRVLQRRRAEGDYLTYKQEQKLPLSLCWENGDDQPELGSPEAVKGGSMRLAIQRSFPGTFRPFGPNSNNATRRYIYDDITLQLTRIHPGTGAIIPGVADRWAVSGDGRTVFFHIDENARFSDGSKLTTRDFITALFVRTSEYAQEPFYGDFYLNNFSHITVYGDNVIAVTLPIARPNAAYYANIPSSCTRFYAEFGPDYTRRYLWRIPPTTGGYTIDPAGVVMGRQLTMKRVENWWAQDRRYTRHSCNVDRIVYSFVTETSKAKELFRMGELDVFSARDVDFWYEGLEIDPVHRGLIQRVQFQNIWPRNCLGIHLNCTCPPVNDIEVRKGIMHALNMQGVINTIFRGDYTHMASYFSGFGPYTDDSLTAPEFDPTEARRHFAVAGYTVEGGDGILTKPDGTRLQLVVGSRVDPLYANCLAQLKEDAARCGLDLRLDVMDDTILFGKVRDKQYMAALWAWGFSPPMPDASQFFLSRYAVQADGSPVKGTYNITATASPELDEAILAAQYARTEEQAIEASHRVQQLIAATASWVPGWTTSFWRFAQWRWVRWPEQGPYPFCPPRYYDPLDSHLYWIDPAIQEDTLRARASGGSFPEVERSIPLPKSGTARDKDSKESAPPQANACPSERAVDNLRFTIYDLRFEKFGTSATCGEKFGHLRTQEPLCVGWETRQRTELSKIVNRQS